MNVLTIGRFAAGGDQGSRCELHGALRSPYSYDAHFTQYDADRRLVKAMIAEHPMVMTCVAFDFDAPGHGSIEEHPEFAAVLEKLPPGWVGYLTHGGFRCLTELQDPITIQTPQDWEEWRAMHAGMGVGLSEVLGAEFDPACSDPSRLFRLPNVVREGKNVYPELYGELFPATSAFAWAPVAVRAAVEVSDGLAGDSFLGAAFHTLGQVKMDDGEKLTVRCPWAHEHSDPSSDEAVVYSDDTGLGKFHCGHSHCKGRGTAEVIEAFSTLPVLKALRERYLLETGPASSAPEPLLTDKPKEARGFLALTPASILAQPLGEIPWLVEGIDFAPGRPMIVGGAAGSGKTYALQEMALSVASGGLVWDHFPVARTGSVLHIDVDQGRYATSMRYQLLARGRGLDLATLPIDCAFFNFAMSNKQGVNPEAIQALGQVTQGRALCIIDSLRGISPGLDEQDSAFGDVLQALANISSVNGCAFAVVAHSGHEQDRTRGTSAIMDRAGAVYQLKRVKVEGSEGHVQWEQKKQSEYGKGSMARFSTVMDRTPSDLNDQTTIRVPSAAQRSERPEEVAQRLVLDELDRYSAKGLTQAQLLQVLAGVPLRKERKIECIHDLEKKKSIVRIVKGQSFIYHPGNRLPGTGTEDGNRSALGTE